MIPEGWKTVEQAAVLAGYEREIIRRWARRIRAEGEYTDAGLTPGSARATSMEYLTGSPARIVKGSDIKRNHRGRIIIANCVVEAMKVSQTKMNELRAQGARTLKEIAEEHGVSVKKVRAVLRAMERQEKREAAGK